MQKLRKKLIPTAIKYLQGESTTIIKDLLEVLSMSLTQ